MNRRRFPAYLVLGAILAAAFTIRLAYHRDQIWSFPTHPDGYEYHRLAQNLLRGRGYGWILGSGHFYRYARTPGYPFFVSMVYGLAGIHPLILRLVDILVSVLSVFLSYLIAKRLYGTVAASAAALLLAFYWRAVLFSADYFSESLFVCLVLGSVLLLYRDWRSNRTLLLSGLILGYAVLVRPSALGFLPAFLVWIMRRSAPLKRRTAASLLFLISALLLPFTWAGYNWLAYSAPPSLSLSSLVGAKSLWQAHNPAVGDEVDNRGIAEVNELRFAHYDLPEKEWASLLKSQAWQFFRESPLRCLSLSYLRFRKHWLGAGIMDGEGTIYPESGKNRYGVLYWYERFWKPSAYFRDNEYVSMHFKKRLAVGAFRIPLLTFEGIVYILAISLIGAAFLRPRKDSVRLSSYWEGSSLLVLMIVFYSLFHFTGFVHHRLRFPLEPLFCILAGGSLSLFTGRLWLLFSPILPSCFHPEKEAIAGSPWSSRAYALFLLCLLLAVGSAFCLRSLRIRGITGKKCAATAPPGIPRGRETLSKREVQFSTLALYRARHGGSVVPFVGDHASWTGEATFVRKMPSSEIRFEPPAYREAWKMLNPGNAPEALLIRLVVGGYRDPDSAGEGEALLMGVPERLPAVSEGDRVTAAGRIAGADMEVMAYPIVALDNIVIWNEPRRPR